MSCAKRPKPAREAGVSVPRPGLASKLFADGLGERGHPLGDLSQGLLCPRSRGRSVGLVVEPIEVDEDVVEGPLGRGLRGQGRDARVGASILVARRSDLCAGDGLYAALEYPERTSIASLVASVIASRRAAWSCAVFFGSFMAAMMALKAAVSLSMSARKASLSAWALTELLQ